ncbi:MAG: fatty acid desaturase family protein [Pseudomonadales bacterium]|jgi:fatty acid desaturase|tara:strand:- start:467 stop:1357 length:891 start_codon:yes stop_codon:yes gene_type:complete
MHGLTQQQLVDVTQKSAPRAWFLVAYDWLLIAGTLSLAALIPNPITLILAIFIIGCRQLSLGIIVHETGHQTFFESKRLNNFVGRWLSGYWVFSSKTDYMKGHLGHHQFAGTLDDPDLKNYAPYPVSKKSFRRKVWRDLSGQTGWRRLRSIGRAIARYSELNPEGQRVVRGGLITNGALFGLLTVLGHPWLYLLWVGAFISTHMLSTRLRQIGEHAAVPNRQSLDPRDHTRTIITNWWERLLIAPHQIGFHLEHHLLPSVPIYRLPTLHKMLIANGYLAPNILVKGYPRLITSITL